MVLSKKKLKQKIRSLLAESVAAAESGRPPRDAAGAEDVKQQLQGLKELLSSKSRRRSRPTRRGGKGKKSSSSSEEAKPAEAGVEDPEEGGDIGASGGSNKKNKKKRNREEDPQTAEADSESWEEGGPIGSSWGSNEKKRREQTKKGEAGGEGATALSEQAQRKEKKEKQEEGKKKRKEKEKKNRKKKKNGEPQEVGVKSGDEDGRTNGRSNEKNETGTATLDTSEENADATRRVYVGGIPYYSTEDDIRSFFEGCGTITEVDCMTFPESGKFRGIAILAFKTDAAAKRALAHDGADMGGLYLKIKPYKGMRTPKTDFSPEIIDGYNRIYVGNLSWDMEEENLRKLFSECKILSIRFGEDKVTGEFKGYAHVDFEDSASLAVALKLDQTVVCGRPVRIRAAVPKKGTESKDASKSVRKSVDGGTSSGSAKKKKRQTCYECGIPGHLSSSCPQKKSLAPVS